MSFVNLQPPIPRNLQESGELLVHSIFYTIQGEGPFAGRPAVFVRLYGCNLQCPGCDTEYTDVSTLRDPEELAAEVERKFSAVGKPLVVLTGGEPLRQNIIPFICELQKLNFNVQIETNGSYALPPVTWDTSIDWTDVTIVCSPKAGKVNKKLQPFISAYKYVATAGDTLYSDGLPKHALGHPAKPHLARPHKNFPLDCVYIQPVDPDPKGANLKHCIKACYKFGYTLCVQIHKIIGVP